MPPVTEAAPRAVDRTWASTNSTERSGADHWSMEGREEEEREFGVSCSMRVDLGVRFGAVRGETKKAGAYCPGFQKLMSVPAEGQSKVRDTSCSAIMRRRLIKA